MGEEIVILGAGFGGLEAATGLSEGLDPSHRITLIDKVDHFYVGFSKFEVMFGRQPAERVKAYYADLAHERVNFVQGTIEAIDLEQKRVRTREDAFNYDYLIVALGAELAPELTPGFVEDGQEFYSLEGAERLYPVLDEFRSGTILLSIFGSPYKCPPAPYEAAFLLHDFYRAKGVREQVAIKMLIPAAVPLPVAPGAAEEVRRRFAERDIELLTEHKVTALAPGEKQAVVAGREPVPYDLFIGVPLHRPPLVVRESALGQGPGGWIRANVETLATEFENVYAIGDVTAIPVGDGAVPKAGAFAEDAAKVVVNNIVHEITGEGRPATFEATGACYLEFGEGNVARISANFLGEEAPQVALEEPSAELRES
ncbi:MAG: FAD-dependent oxidoreductase, partial [Candidatus Promineifilaceae bacterium]|nr:FAD-dependent oxidoreductase [Candidatus Promineifilaceae bacterium]